jgi:hypothetical protein
MTYNILYDYTPTNKIFFQFYSCVLPLCYRLPLIYDSNLWHQMPLGCSLALPYVYSWCGLNCVRRNNVLYFLFGRSHPNHTYHSRNPSPYHPSRYRSASSFISPSGSFTWPCPVHGPSRHTPTTMTGSSKGSNLGSHIFNSADIE